MATLLYFANLLADNCSATNPAETEEIAAIEGAVVSAIVTSQKTHLPAGHGTKMLPLGHLPSFLANSVGSISATTNTRAFTIISCQLCRLFNSRDINATTNTVDDIVNCSLSRMFAWA